MCRKAMMDVFCLCALIQDEKESLSVAQTIIDNTDIYPAGTTLEGQNAFEVCKTEGKHLLLEFLEEEFSNIEAVNCEDVENTLPIMKISMPARPLLAYARRISCPPFRK